MPHQQISKRFTWVQFSKYVKYSKNLSWYWIFALILALVLWNCFANFNVKSIFFLGKTKINHFYSDSDFQRWVLYCHWLFIYSIPIGLDAKKGKRVKDTRHSFITEIIFWPSQIWNLVVWTTFWQKQFTKCSILITSSRMEILENFI